MAVCRIEKTKDYTVMANHHLRNKKISLKAKGLLSLMLSLPEDWDYTVKGLSTICKDGIDSINAVIKELELAGYINRERIRNEKGHLKAIEYTIRETPNDLQNSEPTSVSPIQELPTQDLPILENPILDEPILEKHDQLNTYLLNTNKSNKELLNIDISNPYQSNQKRGCGYEMIGCDSFNELKELIYDNIEYEHFKKHGAITMRERIEEIADIIIETLCSTKPNINIAGEDYPAELVKDKMLKLNSSHIEYVFECLDKNTTYIRNIRRYLLATLFNAPSTIDSYYSALVNHDLNTY